MDYLAQANIDNVDGIATLKGLEGVFGNAVTAFLGLAGIAAFVYLLMGGFRLITAGPNPEAAASAKQQITYAILGLVFIAMSFIILRFIEDFTGAPVTKFRVTQ